jgi:hypothetical protein
MTFEQSFRAHLLIVGIRYKEWYAMIADPQFNNRMNREWIAASERLKDAVDVTFRLKDAWLESGEVPRITEGK